ncbi:MAG TPA: poly granule associated protein [Gammaproteobacteria bacterium]|nr:poly granule associated protein [Gammaproteobacteria bacterium]
MKPDLFENPLTGEVRDFTRQVWLAGLGAFARAQEEGGKVFEALVQEGQTIDAQMKKAASEKTEAVKGRLDGVKDKVEEMRDKATGGWSKLEEVFQTRVARALGQLGVPTHQDIQQLLQQVEALTRNIEELRQTAAAEATRLPKARTVKSTEPDAL